MAAERMTECRKCPHDSVNAGIPRTVKREHCTKCGCPLVAKTASPTSECPLSPPRWVKYMSVAEYDRLKSEIQ